jgi:hypothetical protein
MYSYGYLFGGGGKSGVLQGSEKRQRLFVLIMGLRRKCLFQSLLSQKMAMVLASDTQGGRSNRAGGFEVSRDITDGKSQSAVIAVIGTRSMHEVCVMQGHLTRHHRHGDPSFMVKPIADPLPAPNHVHGLRLVVVFKGAPLVTAWQRPHATGLFGGV